MSCHVGWYLFGEAGGVDFPAESIAVCCLTKRNRWILTRLAKDFDFCICFLLNLCYGVFIPLDEAVVTASPQ
jgi:hypothetical protein